MVRVSYSYSMRDLSGARRRSSVDKFLFHENLSVNLDLGALGVLFLFYEVRISITFLDLI